MLFRPVDLVLRAILEIGCALGLVLGGWASVGGPVGMVVGVVALIAAAAAWATFRVPDDPGPAPWPIPGSARLALELVLLGLGALGWVLAAWPIVGLLLGGLIVGHHLMTAERIRWLLGQR